MIVSILQNVIRKILRRRPCQNILPGVLCVTQAPDYLQECPAGPPVGGVK